ncbi:Piso0_001201 [Millerozyma farinosa CBS 7064]|uniref:Piso0_001201 protein n=1 Tax=Pichia sorbitophila (strain ATCC MYA-4447 / BCRC 22081 / CBS 7064 / NBRC 10061 / NRRL Y-12695) TaxID=559304 RepID=G8YPI9_PICSO|nr:Piso0_001201 [Millerozyma farinosa CBS 7064]CCE79160.1 Piso0_001201 [Millerozyma farinosa CBS 7064]
MIEEYKQGRHEKGKSVIPEIEKYELVREKVEPWSIYVDGSFRGKDGQKYAGYGIYYGPQDSRNESVPLEGANNQRAELRAILHALEKIREDQDGGPYILRTDSNSSIESITVRSLTWEKNGWRTKKKMFVKNKDLIKPAAKLYKEIRSEYKKRGWKFQIEHVKSHTGEDGNEGADKLAILAAELAEKMALGE